MTTYYVSPFGNNGNGLSLATAKTTIAAGVALLTAGDLLLIDSGTYSEPLDNVPSGISDSSRTMVQAINPRTAILTGTTANGWIVEIEQKQYVTIDGILVSASLGGLGGIVIGDKADGTGGSGSSYITVQNCEVYGGQYGIGNHGPVANNHHVSLLNNRVRNQGNTYPTYDTFDGHSIYTGFHDGLVQGNQIEECGNSTQGGAGIHQYSSGTGNLHRNRYIGNRVVRCYGPGILIADGDDCLVLNNILDGNARVDEGAGGVAVSSNSNRTLVANNTIIRNNGAGVWVASSATSVSIINNILYLNGTPITDLSGNATQHHNLIDQNPLFVDLSNSDLRLLEGSPAINAGTDLSAYGFNTDFQGKARR